MFHLELTPKPYELFIVQYNYEVYLIFFFFIRSSRLHSFDGMDMAWEYPTKRGGKPEDRANYVTLLRVSFI
jgi:hypothetical protein